MRKFKPKDISFRDLKDQASMLCDLEELAKYCDTIDSALISLSSAYASDDKALEIAACEVLYDTYLNIAEFAEEDEIDTKEAKRMAAAAAAHLRKIISPSVLGQW